MKQGPPFLLLAAWALCAASCVVYVKPDDDAPPPPPPSPQAIDDTYSDRGGYDSRAADDYDSHAEVDAHVFYDELAPYGRWVDQPVYGRVFIPAGVDAGWRPYSAGRWVESEYGWTWVSDERFGWATYHYGRWYEDPSYGWVWVPGRDWGPAWVSFHEGGGYVGWAPLPPTIGYRAGIGLQLNGIDLSVAIAPRAYVFVPERSFLEPRVATYIAPRERNVTIIRNTTNITNITVINNRVVNRGVPVQRIEQATGHRVQRYQVAATANAPGGAAVEGNQVRIYRPRAAVATGAPTTAPKNPDTMTPGERRRADEAQRRADGDAARRQRVADDQAKAAADAQRRSQTMQDADAARRARIADDQAKAAADAQRRSQAKEDADATRRARVADDQARAAGDAQRRRDAKEAGDEQRRARVAADEERAAERRKALDDQRQQADKARLARIEADKAKQAEKAKAQQEARDKARQEREKKDKEKSRDDQKPPGR